MGTKQMDESKNLNLPMVIRRESRSTLSPDLISISFYTFRVI